MAVFQFASPSPISPGEALLWVQQLAAEGKIDPDDYELREDRTMEGEEFLLVTSPRDKTERDRYETRIRRQLFAPLDEGETFRQRMLTDGGYVPEEKTAAEGRPAPPPERASPSERPGPHVSEAERYFLQHRGLHGLVRMFELGILKGPGKLTVKLAPRSSMRLIRRRGPDRRAHDADPNGVAR
jgi:hypothetical protein